MKKKHLYLVILTLVWVPIILVLLRLPEVVRNWSFIALLALSVVGWVYLEREEG